MSASCERASSPPPIADFGRTHYGTIHIFGADRQRNCTLPVVDFEIVQANGITEIDASILSTDQQYLYEISQVVASGQCTSALGNKQPGKLNHSRWLTTANRILRLYVSSPDPSQNLKDLVDFVMKVYVPTWFDIKSKPQCHQGAGHLLRTFVRSRYMGDDLKEIIDPVIKRNGYFGHPEGVLLAMLKDQRSHIKQLALRRILKAREKSSQEVRTFKVPELNSHAKDYIELIDWETCSVTEPPLTMHLKTEDIGLILRGEIPLEVEFLDLPCHTQAVERTVKLVTEASQSVCGHKNRDGYIRTTLENRKQLPKIESKRDFIASMHSMQDSDSE